MDFSKIKAVQWKKGMGHDGVHRYCQEFLLRTSHGMLRVSEGDWVLSFGTWKSVMSDIQYRELSEEASVNGDS